MPLNNLQHKRAKFILDNKVTSDNVNELYTLIYENGLLNALAFAQKKYDELYTSIFDYIKKDYNEEVKVYDEGIFTDKSQFIQQLLTLNAHEIRHLHLEVLRFLDAIKTYGRGDTATNTTNETATSTEQTIETDTQ